LADVFYLAPKAEMLDSLRRPEAVKAFQTLGVTFAAELDRMEADLGKDRLVEELGCEYTRLFIGPGRHIGPYESLHRSDYPPEHWGPSTAEVKRFIEHHGLGYEDGFKGMPDHISAEFQFISMLADAEADAVEQAENEKVDQAREIQRIFHREHIARWVPVFCDKVVELANLAFYRDFARMAKAVVEADTGELSTRERS
jgi:TorA maturation chaperone TorD